MLVLSTFCTHFVPNHYSKAETFVLFFLSNSVYINLYEAKQDFFCTWSITHEKQSCLPNEVFSCLSLAHFAYVSFQITILMHKRGFSSNNVNSGLYSAKQAQMSEDPHPLNDDVIKTNMTSL